MSCFDGVFEGVVSGIRQDGEMFTFYFKDGTETMGRVPQHVEYADDIFDCVKQFVRIEIVHGCVKSLYIVKKRIL